MTRMAEETKSRPAPPVRAAISIGIPIIGAILFSAIAGFLTGGDIAEPGGSAANALLLGSAGILAWLIGWRWYGRQGMALRGGRPLSASLGFAVLGWVAYLLSRVVLVQSNPEQLVSEGSGRIFLYLLLFEGLAVQVWLFGLVFRSMADWRGPLSATLTSGVLFGLVGSQFFMESFISGPRALLFFVSWGVFYAVIRLRTGSILGIVLVQAVQTLTTWHILLPQDPPAIEQLQNLYLATGILYVIFIWLLWPRELEDYRV